ncbi:hypothetical protein EPR50_G00057240 [Perca flavescens]|uniref:BHLH domain-containing protein n=1 Tax=Perca flavescens TaxID=8167 RepID=A0A484DD94_PERFV|nr:hypothetical protein EPR50_G00057240 [Perca flavescens]
MTDRPSAETSPGPGSGPGSVRGQTLSTIDSAALQAAAVPAEEEEDESVRMKSSSCVLLERHRRKRITQSCSTLRQLLPTIHGGRVDMVTVLETTVAFLETVQDVVAAQDQHIQLCPPAELHADWLRQSQESREAGNKMAAEQEKKKLNRSGRVRLKRTGADRQADGQADGQADRQVLIPAAISIVKDFLKM